MAKNKNQVELERVSPGICMPSRSFGKSEMTPRDVNAILTNADNGQTTQMYEFFDHMEAEDIHLMDVARQRKAAIQRLKYTIEGNNEDQDSVKKKEFVSELIKNIPKFSEVLLNLGNGIFHGLSVHEIMWFRENGTIKVELIYLPSRMFMFPSSLNFGSEGCADIDTPRLKTKAYDLKGIELVKDKFLVHTPRTRSAMVRSSGLFRPAVKGFYLKHYALGDASRFIEKFGLPFIWGKYPPGMRKDHPDIAALKEFIEGFVSDAGGLAPSNMEIQPIDVNKGGGGIGIHLEFVRYWDQAFTRLGLGQVMTTGQDGNIGSEAKARVGENVVYSLMCGDACSIEDTINEQLIKPAIFYQFGNTESIPKFKFVIEKPVDLRLQIEVDKILLNEIKLPLSKKYFYDKYKIEPPGEDDELVEGNTSNQGFSTDIFAGQSFSNSTKNPETTRATKAEIKKYQKDRAADMEKRERNAIKESSKVFGEKWSKKLDKAVKNSTSFEEVEKQIEKE